MEINKEERMNIENVIELNDDDRIRYTVEAVLETDLHDSTSFEELKDAILGFGEIKKVNVSIVKKNGKI